MSKAETHVNINTLLNIITDLLLYIRTHSYAINTNSNRFSNTHHMQPNEGSVWNNTANQTSIGTEGFSHMLGSQPQTLINHPHVQTDTLFPTVTPRLHPP